MPHLRNPVRRKRLDLNTATPTTAVRITMPIMVLGTAAVASCYLYRGVLRSRLTLHFLRLLASGAPYLTRKLTSAKTKLHPDKYFHGPSTQESHFSRREWHYDDFGLRSPVIQKIFWRKCATFIVERVLGGILGCFPPSTSLVREAPTRVVI